MTHLNNGVYHILDSSRRVYIGRSLREDLDVLPKPVVSVAPTEGDSPPKVRTICSLGE